MMNRTMSERLDNREVRILQLDVLADDRDPDLSLESIHAIGERLPLRHVGGRGRNAEPIEHEIVEPLLVQRECDAINI